MTKYSVDPNHRYDRPEAPVGAGLPSPTGRDGASCELYAPGHQMHYKHQGNAVRSPSLVVRNVRLEGTEVTLALDGRPDLAWRHHDPGRLGRILDLLGGKGVIYPEHHALRVGPYWFNCAGEADDWQDCALSTANRQA